MSATTTGVAIADAPARTSQDAGTPSNEPGRLPRLRPYQAAVARAVLERVVGGEGGSISVEIARQGGKNELSAQLELLLLTHQRRGGTIIKCAPTFEPQAAISRDRLLARADGARLGAIVRREGAGSVRCGRAAAR